jgi:plasminogen activator inhibitor 1 RNA-binding protein
MVEYGVNVTNKFAFLSGDEEDDPVEVLKKAELAKKQKAAEPKPKKKVTIQPAVTPVAPVDKIEKQVLANKENIEQRRGGPRKEQGQRGQGPPRGPRREGQNKADAMADRFGEGHPPSGGNRRGPSDRPPRFNNGPRREGEGNFERRRPPRTENRSGDENQFVSADDHTRDNTTGRPSGGYRGGARRGGAGFGQRNDRTSGSDKTGVRPTQKKDGHGTGNWGTTNDELVGETEKIPNPDDSADLNKSNDTTGENVQVVDGEEQKTEEQLAEEERQRALTLEEWKAQHKTEKPQFNVRKPGEGQEKLHQKLVPLKRDADDEDITEEEIVYVNKRGPREKPLNIEVSFSDAQRSRGGGGGGHREGGGRNFERPQRSYRDDNNAPPRGGGGPRGGGHRDAPRAPGGGPRSRNNQNFNLSDEAFPALGAR